MLRPRSIAIVGASPSPGSLGRRRARQSGALRFARRRPSGERQPHRDQRAAVRELPRRPCRKASIARCSPSRSAGVLDAVAGCAARGVGGVIIYAAGFAEAGPKGVELQAEIARIARDHDMAISGPNCLGHINYVDGIPLTFSACTPVRFGRTAQHRHRVAKRRYGDRVARGLAPARYRNLVFDLYRQRGAQRQRGFSRLSDRRRMPPMSC